MNEHMVPLDGCHVTVKSKAFKIFDESLIKSISVNSFL